jgi:cation-transporting ATPase F
MTMSLSSSATAHHGLAAHEVVLLLETDPHRGLTGQEAAERLGGSGRIACPLPRVPGCSCGSFASSTIR